LKSEKAVALFNHWSEFLVCHTALYSVVRNHAKLV
jgi:hypothetical protein